MASVRKRKWTHNGVEKECWVVAYTDQSGKRRLKSFERKKDADKYRLSVEVEIEQGIHVATSETVTFSAAADAYLKECGKRHQKGDRMTGYSLKNYTSAANLLKKRFGALLLTKIDAKLLQDYADQLDKNRAAATVSQRLKVLQNILDFSVKSHWIKRNILKDSPVRTRKRKKEKASVPTKADVLALQSAVMKRDVIVQHHRNYLNRRVLVMLGIFAGLRCGEVAGLQWENVDFDNNVLRIRHSYSDIDGLKEPKSSAGVRDIPMSGRIREALLEIRRYWILRERVARNAVERPGDSSALNQRLAYSLKRGDQPLPDESLTGYVLRAVGKAEFASPVPIGATNLLTNHWRQIMTAAGLVDSSGKPKFTTHKMRHVAVSLLIEVGLPAFNLKTMIGHSSVTTTYDIYGHLFPSDERSTLAVATIASSFDATTARQEA